MFTFKLKPEILSANDRDAERRFFLLMHRDVLERMEQDTSHFLFLTGGTGLGKTILIGAWLDQIAEKAKKSGRALVTIRFMQSSAEAQMRYLNGKLRLKAPGNDGGASWDVSIDPTIPVPVLGNVGIKINIHKSAKEKATDYPIDQQANDAREQLVKLASKKNFPIVSKPPVVVVTFERLDNLGTVVDVKQIFDANTALPLDQQIFFLISGNMNLHAVWWQQRTNDGGLLTQFKDYYLGHSWSMESFCEKAVDRAETSNHEVLVKLPHFLVVASNGKLQQIWEFLNEGRQKGIPEEDINRCDRFYNILFQDDTLINAYAPSMSLVYSQAEYTDRLKWAVAEFIKWFAIKWIGEPTISSADMEKLKSRLDLMIGNPETCQKLIDDLFNRLAFWGYLKKKDGTPTIAPVKCLHCDGEHFPAIRYCPITGKLIPTSIVPEIPKSRILCPYCHGIHRKDARFCPTTGKPLPVPPGIVPRIEPTLLTGTLPPGFVLQARYRIIRLLNRGGFGSTYLAGDLRLDGKQWAIKEMYVPYQSDAPEAIEQFRREAGMLTRLDHPNAVRIADFFEQGNCYYLVMDFVEGENLENLIQIGGKLTDKQLRDIALQMLDLLDYLHSRNPPIIFRDVKPSNIMLTPEGRVIVVDFGIARMFKPGKKADTRSLGTPAYAPPEQYGDGQTDACSDIYSLGATMFNLCTGCIPPPSPEREARPDESLFPTAENSRYKGIIEKAMAINPRDRFQNANEMKQAIAKIKL